MTALRLILLPALVAALRVHDDEEKDMQAYTAGTPQNTVGCELAKCQYCLQQGVLGADPDLVEPFKSLIDNDFMKGACGDFMEVDCTTCPTYAAPEEFLAIVQEPAFISPGAQANLEAEEAAEKAEVGMIFEEASAPSGEVMETDGFGQAELETLAPLESVEEIDADLDQLPLARM